jgi:hypothetical protein
LFNNTLTLVCINEEGRRRKKAEGGRRRKMAEGGRRNEETAPRKTTTKRLLS